MYVPQTIKTIVPHTLQTSDRIYKKKETITKLLYENIKDALALLPFCPPPPPPTLFHPQPFSTFILPSLAISEKRRINVAGNVTAIYIYRTKDVEIQQPKKKAKAKKS